MKWRFRARGFFEGPPRLLFRVAGPRYIDAAAVAMVLNGLVVSSWVLLTLVLYVDVSVGELAVFAACTALAYLVEGAVAGIRIRRVAAPITAWLGGRREDAGGAAAWAAAARLPLAILRCADLYVVGVLGVAAADVVLTAELGLPIYEAWLLLPTSILLYLYSAVLRWIALELGMRPVLEAVGEQLGAGSPGVVTRVSLNQRLLATVPMVSWGTAMVVTGLLTHDTRSLDRIGLASFVAIGVTGALSIWLSLLLADAVSAPIVDLRAATRRVGGGDLTTRVPVISTDETGELAMSFNEMVAGLGERERLREAVGVFVDPLLTERIVAEGTDLKGEVVDASVLFIDVRDFTAFAERAPADEVVACLNALFERLVPVIVRHGGHANKFIGDGLMAVFGVPERHADHQRRAVAAAREIAAMAGQEGSGDLRVGIGINSGPVVVGTIGGGGRRDFTVIGDPVNTAARVEAATRLTGDDLLVTEHTLNGLGALRAEFEERSAAPLKGKSQTVRLYAPRRRDAASQYGDRP